VKDELVQSLDRSLLLMRDELDEGVSDQKLVDALTETEVVLAGDVENLSSHAAQCAFVTAALLMARSGHRVVLSVPDAALVGPQPPLKPGTLLSSLLEIGADLLPGIEFIVGMPRSVADLCVSFGDARAAPARRTISVNASGWSAQLQSRCGERWHERRWPCGAMAAGALAAGEAFKASVHKLRHFARAADNFDEMFAFSDDIRFDLAPPDAMRAAELGAFDLVSGGAIANAVLFCLGRIPSVTGAGRVIDDTYSDRSNLNRYKLLRRSQVSRSKVDALSETDLGGLNIQPVRARYDESTATALGPLATHVLVGVDHIPTRWLVQRAQPHWLGIGATTHWNAMASVHGLGLPCAWCAHPRDDHADTPIPTVAFVTFWAGLLLACQFLRRTGPIQVPMHQQHTFLTPFRPESVWQGAIAARSECPLCGSQRPGRAA
jgi:hypothetical protein